MQYRFSIRRRGHGKIGPWSRTSGCTYNTVILLVFGAIAIAPYVVPFLMNLLFQSSCAAEQSRKRKRKSTKPQVSQKET